jgi:hypothetical protein
MPPLAIAAFQCALYLRRRQPPLPSCLLSKSSFSPCHLSGAPTKQGQQFEVVVGIGNITVLRAVVRPQSVNQMTFRVEKDDKKDFKFPILGSHFHLKSLFWMDLPARSVVFFSDGRRGGFSLLSHGRREQRSCWWYDNTVMASMTPLARTEVWYQRRKKIYQVEETMAVFGIEKVASKRNENQAND